MAETILLARQLAGLVAEGSQVPATDLSCALAAHAQLLELLSTVHTGLTHTRRQPKPSRDVTRLEADPVALLGWLLRDFPRLDPEEASTDLLSHRCDSNAGARWQQVMRHATLAHHAWRQADPGSLPAAEDAWSALADLAALAQTAACLTPTLMASRLDSGHAPSTPGHADVAAVSGALWRTAAQVRMLADLGPLPPVDEPTTRPRWPLRVSRPEALPEAQRRLRSFLARGTFLRPEHLEQVAAAQSRSLMAIAPLLPDDAANALMRQSRALTRVLERPGSLTAIRPGDARAVVQAREIDDFVNQTTNLTPLEKHPSYRDWATLTAATIQELFLAATRHYSGRRWLAPEPANPGRWSTTRVPPTDPNEPHLIKALRGSAAAATRTSPVLRRLAVSPTVGTRAGPANGPREILNPDWPTPTQRPEIGKPRPPTL